MITRPKISSVVASQLPEFIRDDYQTFIDFLKAYYQFLETTQQDPVSLRDLDTTLDSFITNFKSELSANLPYSTVSERFLLTKIKDLYLAKGSEASFKLLFRILFNKPIEINYPSTQMLRASDGKWNQDVSIFVNVLVGTPNDIIGKLVDVVSQTKIIRVLVDRRQYVEVSVDRAIKISDSLYELIIDRRFFGTVSVGDTLRYIDPVTNLTVFNAIIVPTTSTLTIQSPGTGFKVGGLYSINNYNGYGTIMKVSSVDSNGGLVTGQFIKYGAGYTTDFTTTLSAASGQDVSGTAGTTIQRTDTITGGGTTKTVNLTFTESLNGFSESGSINTADYNIESASEIAADILAYGVAKGNFFDGAYAGVTLREFGITNINSLVTSTSPAVIKVTLGALAKYPGYYINNDGFLDDAIYIQDSKFYQSFSYVIKIDQTLESYKTIIKNLIHPSGMQIFGEYDIRNEITINTTLESLIKILSVTLNDSIITSSGSDVTDLTRTGPYWAFSKPIDESNLNTDGSSDSQTVVISELAALSTTKPIDDTNNKNYDGSTDTFYVTMTETSTVLDNTKLLDASHYLNDGTTVDNETVAMAEVSTVLDNTKLLDASHYLNDGTTVDNESVVLAEPTVTNPDGISVRYGVTTYGVSKTFDSTAYTHYLNDGTTVDNETVTIIDNDFSNLNRTTPAFVYTTTIDPSYYSGNDNAVPTDSGGFLDVNPYAEAGIFLNDSGLYVGNQITFTG